MIRNWLNVSNISEQVHRWSDSTKTNISINSLHIHDKQTNSLTQADTPVENTLGVIHYAIYIISYIITVGSCVMWMKKNQTLQMAELLSAPLPLSSSSPHGCQRCDNNDTGSALSVICVFIVIVLKIVFYCICCMGLMYGSSFSVQAEEPSVSARLLIPRCFVQTPLSPLTSSAGMSSVTSFAASEKKPILSILWGA